MGCRKLIDFKPDIWLPDRPRAIGRARGVQLDRRDIKNFAFDGAAPFSGNFATLFPGAYQVVQSDLGLTYGGTLLAQVGNTSTTVVTLTGTLSATPVPIWVVANNAATVGAGANFSVYFDGAGLIEAMNVTPSAGVPVPLTGAGSGASLTWAAGTGATGDGWKATCAALADQSGNALHYSQATATKQPVIAVGLSGKASIIGDGVDDFLGSSLNIPTPGTTAHYTFAVFRQVSFTINRSLFGHGPSGNNSNVYFTSSSGTMDAFNGSNVFNAGVVNGSWQESERVASNQVSDTFKVGTTTVAGNAGNLGCTGIQLFASGSASFGNFELLALAFTPNLPDWTAVRSAVTSFYGASVLV